MDTGGHKMGTQAGMFFYPADGSKPYFQVPPARDLLKDFFGINHADNHDLVPPSSTKPVNKASAEHASVQPAQPVADLDEFVMMYYHPLSGGPPLCTVPVARGMLIEQYGVDVSDGRLVPAPNSTQATGTVVERIPGYPQQGRPRLHAKQATMQSLPCAKVSAMPSEVCVPPYTWPGQSDRDNKSPTGMPPLGMSKPACGCLIPAEDQLTQVAKLTAPLASGHVLRAAPLELLSSYHPDGSRSRLGDDSMAMAAAEAGENSPAFLGGAQTCCSNSSPLCSAPSAGLDLKQGDGDEEGAGSAEGTPVHSGQIQSFGGDILEAGVEDRADFTPLLGDADAEGDTVQHGMKESIEVVQRVAAGDTCPDSGVSAKVCSRLLVCRRMRIHGCLVATLPDKSADACLVVDARLI